MELWALALGWVTTRVVSVITTLTVVVASVPAVVLLEAPAQVHAEDEPPVIVLAVQGDDRAALVKVLKDEGDKVVAALGAAESSCDVQIDQAAAGSKQAQPRTQEIVARAKSQVHSASAPLVVAVQRDEDEFEHLDGVTPEVLDRFLSQIHLIKVTALGGDDDRAGVITVTCQTVVVEVRELLVVVVVKREKEDDED